MKAAIYIRVSSDDQRERETIKTQVDEIDRYLGAHPDLVPFDWYRDDGVSGTIPLAERPEGGRLHGDARAGKFDVILITRADRLGRDVVDLMQTRELFESLGIHLVGIVEPLDNEMTFDLLAILAKYERRRFLARSREGIERAVKEGRYTGGIVPYGYRVQGEQGTARLVPDDRIVWGDKSAADIIRLLFDLVGRLRWSCRQVCDYFNELGVPTHYVKDGRSVGGKSRGHRQQRTSGLWRPNRILRLVRETSYRGEPRFGKRSTTRNEVLSGNCPPLVSTELWHAAQDAIMEKRSAAPSALQRRYLLRSLIVCGNCGRAFTGNMHKRDGRTWYRCCGRGAYRGLGHDGCISKLIDGDALEALVLDDIVRFLRNPGDVIDELTVECASDATAAVAESERVILQGRLDQLDHRRQRLVSLLTAELITEDEFRAQAIELSDSRGRVASRLAALTQVAAPAADSVFPGDLLEELRQRVDAGLTREQMFEIVGLLVARIRAHTERESRYKATIHVEIEYRFPAVVVDHTGRG